MCTPATARERSADRPVGHQLGLRKISLKVRWRAPARSSATLPRMYHDVARVFEATRSGYNASAA